MVEQKPVVGIGTPFLWEKVIGTVCNICRGYVVIAFPNGRHERVTFHDIERALPAK